MVGAAFIEDGTEALMLMTCILEVPWPNLSWDINCLEFFMVFLVFSKWVPGQYLKSGRNCFRPHRFPLFVNCAIMPCWVVCAANIIITSNKQKPIPSQHMMKEHIQHSKVNVSVNTCMTNDLTIDGH